MTDEQKKQWSRVDDDEVDSFQPRSEEELRIFHEFACAAVTLEFERYAALAAAKHVLRMRRLREKLPSRDPYRAPGER